MHEEKSRFYWYQFSDYTLVWPTNTRKHPSGCFFVLNAPALDTNQREAGLTTSERHTGVCRSAKPMSAGAAE